MSDITAQLEESFYRDVFLPNFVKTANDEATRNGMNPIITNETELRAALTLADKWAAIQSRQPAQVSPVVKTAAAMDNAMAQAAPPAIPQSVLSILGSR